MKSAARMIFARNNIYPAIIMLLSCLITFFRWPEILLNPQFWGEDGWNWWPEARNIGLPSLWLPHTGYLQTDDRIVGLIAAPFPLVYGPTIFAIAAVIFELLPVFFLISRRGASLCPSLPLRGIIAIGWCALPNSWEVHANLTNSQWHLAILSFLILASAAPRTIGSWIFDVVMLAIGALSGPFSIILSPIAAFRAWQMRSKSGVCRLAIVVTGAMLQAIILHSAHRGIPPNLGASPSMFVHLIAAQIMLAPMVGHTHLPYWYSTRLWHSGLLPWGVFLSGVWLCIDAARRWPVMRLATAFIIIFLSASLSHPLPSGDGSPVWATMLLPDSQIRYLFVAIIFWVTVVIVEVFTARDIWTKSIALTIAFLTVFFGIPHDWRFPAEPDRNFYAIARKFDAAPRNQVFKLPVRPQNWAVYVR